ncbi:phosphomethylpyrimidine synthase ThiC [Candidatus Contubernalis alkaliaceticus]|uniref:phosphomethylpyrimidine synthase ThiC n=1 Tax=Candidatus Contubernalis alkaliaceticus TaxID=338645 RepID=UPI001F4BFA42|nr:phosphomethylpyrimidine synthase ThiC [Candidatus Contubernalis alkalaceticus]UNC91442.1 phosphomethylpyrimidine synthase ThiC [Candidatus Contubernalis alkalaceticus]
MTQLVSAKQGRITHEMEKVASKEQVDIQALMESVACGQVVIPANPRHVNLEPEGFGKGLKTKVNANIGISMEFKEREPELEKLKAAVEAGAHAVMDLSTGPYINEIRREIIKSSPVPVGTVPVYQVAVSARQEYGSVTAVPEENFLKVIEEQAKEGVDFMTVHCGITLESLERLKEQDRVLPLVSRGGAIMAAWMIRHGKENPYFRYYDQLLELALEYDVTLSLGDGFRPGCVSDATDRPQIQELLILGELVDRAREKGVQVMVEGPGHVPLDQIAANVQLQKRICREAPFYVLGPLVTDIAPGYDHIVSAIGGTVAAAAGADFLCYVTPAEHLGLPDAQDVREGVMASRIAAHAADLVKGVKGAAEKDLSMAKARRDLDWETQFSLAIDPVKAKAVWERKNPEKKETCSMCGEYCALRVVEDHLK